MSAPTPQAAAEPVDLEAVKKAAAELERSSEAAGVDLDAEVAAHIAAEGRGEVA